MPAGRTAAAASGAAAVAAARTDEPAPVSPPRGPVPPTPTVYALVHPFVQLALLRRRPQDFPWSPLLLGLVLLAHWVLGIVLFSFRLPVSPDAAKEQDPNFPAWEAEYGDQAPVELDALHPRDLTAITRAGASIILTYHLRDMLAHGWYDG